MSVNRDNRTFRLRDTERGTVRIRVNRNTRYRADRRLPRPQRRHDEHRVAVRRSNGRWVALEVEASGGGGEHGGDDDDDSGDDHGGGRRGSDDD